MPINPKAAENLKPFVKGDPRAWRLGRPKNMDGVKELAQALVHEEVLNKDGKPEIIAGHKATVLEVVLRQWIKSNDFRKQQAALEFAFGKVSTPIEHSGSVNVSSL